MEPVGSPLDGCDASPLQLNPSPGIWCGLPSSSPLHKKNTQTFRSWVHHSKIKYTFSWMVIRALQTLGEIQQKI